MVNIVYFCLRSTVVMPVCFNNVFDFFKYNPIINMFSSEKKMYLRLIPVLLGLPLFSNAQQPKLLPLQEAVSLARAHSSQLKADSLQMLISRSQVSGSAALQMPQLVVNSTFQRLSNNIEPYTISLPSGSFQINPQILSQSYNALQLSQLLYSGGKVRNNTRALQKESQAVQSDYRRSILSIDQQITDLWYNLYNARASEKLILANIEVLKKKREDVEAFRLQGIVLENDVLKIDLSVTTLRSGLADIVALSGTLNYTVCLLTGIDPNTPIEIPDNYMQGLTSIAALNTYMDAALLNRPEFESFKLRNDAAVYRVKAAKADYLPTLNMVASYNYDKPNQRIIPNLSQFNYSALAGLTFSWKISSFYTNRSHVNESRYLAAQLQASTQLAKENIQKEVNTCYLEYRKTLEKLTLVKTELEQATENYRVEQNKLNAQTTTPTDFLIANTAMLQAQLNVATSKANAGLAYYKLMIATGNLHN